MSDSTLRELERRFRQTDSPEHELAWLRARAKSEERLAWADYLRLQCLDEESSVDYLSGLVHERALTSGRLRLAAHCGHTPAQTLAGERWPEVGTSAWREGFPDAVSYARIALGAVASSDPRDERSLRAIAAAEAWVLDPGEETRVAVAASLASESLPPFPARAAALAAATDAEAWRGPGSKWNEVSDAEIERLQAHEQACVALGFAPGELGAAFEQVVREELLPWALGFSDPLRERVEARQRDAVGREGG